MRSSVLLMSVLAVVFFVMEIISLLNMTLGNDPKAIAGVFVSAIASIACVISAAVMNDMEQDSIDVDQDIDA